MPEQADDPVRAGARWRRWIGAALLLLGAMWLGLLFFPWDGLRGPLTRYVSEQTGRHFEITQHLGVDWSPHGATVILDGIELANPDWAREPWLLRARSARLQLRLLPLLSGHVVIPRLQLASPQVALELQPDGRRSWSIVKAGGKDGSRLRIGAVQVDHGKLDFLAPDRGIDLKARFDYNSAHGALPRAFEVDGQYRHQPFEAGGRSGGLVQIEDPAAAPFPIQLEARAGATQLKVTGSVARLQGFDGVDASFNLKGPSLGALFPLLGLALPETSPYALSGHLKRTGTNWQVSHIGGRLGLSDLEGELLLDVGPATPQLTGKLQSRSLDMDDIGPLIGLPPTARAARSIEGVAAPPSIGQTARARGPDARVLPDAKLDFERLRAINTKVAYDAKTVHNVHGLPLDSASVQVNLQDRVMVLDPLTLGLGGGKLSGSVRIDARHDPADIRAQLRLQGVQLGRLVPKIESMKANLGRLDGSIKLAGSGTSVAGWLGDASGEVTALTGSGRLSNLLLEFMGLDGAEIIKFLLRGDQSVKLRCAAAAFDVKDGRMKARILLLDTDDTVFYGSGDANLATERLDFVLSPQPKDVSILSLRGPLTLRGSFAHPQVGVEAKPLAERALAALALGAINPLLSLLATVETGPGEDANCPATLQQARRLEAKGGK